LFAAEAAVRFGIARNIGGPLLLELGDVEISGDNLPDVAFVFVKGVTFAFEGDSWFSRKGALSVSTFKKNEIQDILN
jgi:hypothetical protein